MYLWDGERGRSGAGAYLVKVGLERNSCLDSKGSHLCLENMIRENVGMKDNSVLKQR